MLIIDFVARGPLPNEWRLVLVEQGPWTGPVADEIRRVQERLYGCLDAALDGLVAEKLPDSKGGDVVISLACYNLPAKEVAAFFDAWRAGVLKIPDYEAALNKSPFVGKIRFDITFDAISLV